ncbi:MAG: hypothetical protein WDW36_003772 [Sanguina aurantia]
MQQAGLESWIDVIGNVHGVTPTSAAPGAAAIPAIFVGSHYDTVLDAGKFDGALGVIVAIAAVKNLLVQALSLHHPDIKALIAESTGDDNMVQIGSYNTTDLLPMPVHIVGFTDEEGVRFGSTFLGSRALVGTLAASGALASTDISGESLLGVMTRESGQETVDIDSIAVASHTIDHFIEVHIEQGPVLESRQTALGVVSGIAGQTRLEVVVVGLQGHAGTVPMSDRHDAATAAAEIVLGVERLCQTVPTDHTDAPPPPPSLVCTVGAWSVWPGASNVIPGKATFSIDVRSSSDAVRLRVVAALQQDILAPICTRRGVECVMLNKHSAPAMACDPSITAGLRQAVLDSQGLVSLSPSDTKTPTQLEDIPVMVSGAGHDTMAMGEVTKVGMMFVRSVGGFSHSPLEHTSPDDVAAATAALSQYLHGRVYRGAVKDRCLTQFQLMGFSVTCFPWVFVFVDSNFLVAWMNGGPVSLLYGWVIAMAGTALVTLSLAEVASACPNIGGLYYYSARLAPGGYKGVAGFMTAWCNICGVMTSLAILVVQLTRLFANMRYAITYDAVKGTGQLTTSHELFYMCMIMLLVMGVLASAPSRAMAVYLTFAMFLSIVCFFSFPVAILSLAPSHSSAGFVFHGWEQHSADTGVHSRGFAFMLASLSAISALTGWDTTIYMTEESLRPTYTVPTALRSGFLWVTSCGGLSLVMILFSIQHPVNLLSSSSVFGGKQPVSQILWDVTQARLESGSASVVFLALEAMGLFLMCLFLVIGSSRKLYAMSRDKLVLGSAWWSVLHPRLLIPLASTWAIIGAQMVLGLTLLADDSQTIFFIVTVPWLPLTLASYLLPILICLTTRERLQPGPWNMGAYGPYVRAGAAAYLILALVVSLLSLTYPLTAVNLPYAPIMALAFLACMQLCWWLPVIGVRHFYSGPVSERLGRVNFAITSPFLAPPGRRSRGARILKAASPFLRAFMRSVAANQGPVHTTARAGGLAEPEIPAGVRVLAWRSMLRWWGSGTVGCDDAGRMDVVDSARSSPISFYRQPTLQIPGEMEALNRAQSYPRHPAGYAGKKAAPKPVYPLR